LSFSTKVVLSCVNSTFSIISGSSAKTSSVIFLQIPPPNWQVLNSQSLREYEISKCCLVASSVLQICSIPMDEIFFVKSFLPAYTYVSNG
jgi:hypothetical protein